MNFRYSIVTLWILVGLVGHASAEPRYPELLGDWSANTSFANCTPCVLSIQGVRDDGQLVLKTLMAGDFVESGGQVTRDGGQIAVHITLADGHSLDLSVSKSGKYLEGFGHSYAQHGGGAGAPINFRRVKPRK